VGAAKTERVRHIMFLPTGIVKGIGGPVGIGGPGPPAPEAEYIKTGFRENRELEAVFTGDNQ